MTTPNALHPNVLTPADLEPNWRWEGRLPAWGTHRLILNGALIMIGCVATA